MTVYDFILGVPVQTDNTNFDFILGSPYVIYDTTQEDAEEEEDTPLVFGNTGKLRFTGGNRQLQFMNL